MAFLHAQNAAQRFANRHPDNGNRIEIVNRNAPTFGFKTLKKVKKIRASSLVRIFLSHLSQKFGIRTIRRYFYGIFKNINN